MADYTSTLGRFSTLLPLCVDTVCTICGKETSVNGDYNPFDLGFARVDGNSANGYEIYHISCCEG
jgi:hypothetical protein